MLSVITRLYDVLLILMFLTLGVWQLYLAWWPASGQAVAALFPAG